MISFRAAPLWLLVLVSCELPVHFVASWDESDGGVITEAGSETSGACASHADCPAGRICSWATGECIEPTGAICGLPQTSGDALGLGAACTLAGCTPDDGDACLNASCGADKVCVPGREWKLPLDGQEYLALAGTCLQACDPCATPSLCAAGEHCVALAERGGFCYQTALFPICAAAPVCPPRQQCHASACFRTCTPDDRTIGFLDQASPSPDCDAKSLCKKTFGSMDAQQFVCLPGALAEWGTACDPAAGRFCSLPCIHDICSPDCSIESCPDGLSCYQLIMGVSVSHACIQDSAIPRDGVCAEDRNCQEALRCLPYGGGTTCQPAG